MFAFEVPYKCGFPRPVAPAFTLTHPPTLLTTFATGSLTSRPNRTHPITRRKDVCHPQIHRRPDRFRCHCQCRRIQRAHASRFLAACARSSGAQHTGGRSCQGEASEELRTVQHWGLEVEQRSGLRGHPTVARISMEFRAVMGNGFRECEIAWCC